MTAGSGGLKPARVLCVVLALTVSWPAAAAAPPKAGGDKITGSAGRPAAQPLPAHVPHGAPAAAVIGGDKAETVKQLDVPATLAFDVGPGGAQTRVVILAAGDVFVHLEPDPYGDGDGFMMVVGPGNLVVCQTALQACALHIAETGRYALTVRNRGGAKGAFPMVFSLPRTLPGLGNAAKPRPH